jgi:two-component system cell cycle sensor histidine kinase/response regulator CckA
MPERANRTQPTLVRDDKVILAVDDDHMVLRFVCRVLCLRGYTRLLAANHPTRALELAGRYQGRIDLLLSDVVMPYGLNGPELAKRITLHRPETRVLLMSGYEGHALQMEPGWQFIQKPFRPAELIRGVENALSHAEGIEFDMPMRVLQLHGENR